MEHITRGWGQRFQGLAALMDQIGWRRFMEGMIYKENILIQNIYSSSPHQASLQEIRPRLGLLLTSPQGHQVYLHDANVTALGPTVSVWSAIQPTKHESHEHRNSIADAVGISQRVGPAIVDGVQKPVNLWSAIQPAKYEPHID